MTQISRKWIQNGAIDHTKLDSSDSYTMRGVTIKNASNTTVSSINSSGVLYATGDATFTNKLRVNSDATVGGNLKIIGSADLGSVGFSDATLTGGLNVGSNEIINTDLLVGRDTTIGGVLNITPTTDPVDPAHRIRIEGVGDYNLIRSDKTGDLDISVLSTHLSLTCLGDTTQISASGTFKANTSSGDPLVIKGSSSYVSVGTEAPGTLELTSQDGPVGIQLISDADTTEIKFKTYPSPELYMWGGSEITFLGTKTEGTLELTAQDGPVKIDLISTGDTTEMRFRSYPSPDIVLKGATDMAYFGLEVPGKLELQAGNGPAKIDIVALEGDGTYVSIGTGNGVPVIFENYEDPETKITRIGLNYIGGDLNISTYNDVGSGSAAITLAQDSTIIRMQGGVYISDENMAFSNPATSYLFMWSSPSAAQIQYVGSGPFNLHGDKYIYTSCDMTVGSAAAGMYPRVNKDFRVMGKTRLDDVTIASNYVNTGNNLLTMGANLTTIEAYNTGNYFLVRGDATIIGRSGDVRGLQVTATTTLRDVHITPLGASTTTIDIGGVEGRVECGINSDSTFVLLSGSGYPKIELRAPSYEIYLDSDHISLGGTYAVDATTMTGINVGTQKVDLTFKRGILTSVSASY